MCEKGVTLSGADGSGKTTAAKILGSYLVSRGVKVCIHWFRGSHLFASALLRFLSRSEVFKGSCNPYYNVCVPKKLKFLWFPVEFISFIPHLLTRLLLKHTCFVIGDRGVIDFIVWVIATLREPHLISSLFSRFLLALSTGENTVYLYADPQILTGRADTPEKFILRELAIYNTLSKYFTKLSIDTSRHSPSETAARVLKWLGIA